MAYFPCAHCGQRYHGPQQTAYPALVSGTASHREKQRLCPDCFVQLLTWCTDALIDTADGKGPISYTATRCGLCSSDDPLAWSAFVTVYPKGEARADYWGRICADCTDGAVVSLFGDPGLPSAT